MDMECLSTYLGFFGLFHQHLAFFSIQILHSFH